MTKQIHRPYGAMNSKGRYDEFIAAWGWKYISSAYCLHWISTGRRCRCYDNRDSHSWMDHTSGYTRQAESGLEHLLLCQPYFLNDPESLVAAAKKFNLDFAITGRGWYGHGTVTIELRPLEEVRRANAFIQSKMEAAAAARKAAAAARLGINAGALDPILRDWDE